MAAEYQINLTEIPFWILLAGSFLCAFLITWFSIPTIVKISNFKKLFDIPNERTSHEYEVPTLGGLALFAGFTLSSMIFTLYADAIPVKYLITGIIIIFFVGLKDDILVIDPRKKFLGQLAAASIVVILGDIRLTSFYSVIGMGEISYGVSLIISVFIFLTLINGFNLIDGVDGLSAGTGIIAALFFGICNTMAGLHTDAIISFSLAGTLIAYFWFNVYSSKNKIFMGDTGSMITGFIIAFLTIRFIESANEAPGVLRLDTAPAITFGLLIVPLFDTLRIIVLRLVKGASPFMADHNHIHHNLLKIGFSHRKTTMYILGINIVLLLGALTFQRLGNTVLIMIILFVAALLSGWSDYLARGAGVTAGNGHGLVEK